MNIRRLVRPVLAMTLSAALLTGCAGGNQLVRVSTDPEDTRVSMNGQPGNVYLVDNKYDFPMDSIYVKAKKPGFHAAETVLHRELDLTTAVLWSILPAIFTGTSIATGAPNVGTVSGAVFWGFFTVLPWVHSYKFKEMYGMELAPTKPGKADE